MTVNLKTFFRFLSPPNVTVVSGGAASQRVQHTPVSVFLPALLSPDDKGRVDDSEPFPIPYERMTASLSADACPQIASNGATVAPGGKRAQQSVLVAVWKYPTPPHF